MLECRRMTANGWRLGGRAGERKSSNGRQTFKSPQNFPRAYTPHDAKPFVGRSAFYPIYTNS